MTRQEQLYGGDFDGLIVETQGNPQVFTLPCGRRFFRRRDGLLYAEGSRWDEREGVA